MARKITQCLPSLVKSNWVQRHNKRTKAVLTMSACKNITLSLLLGWTLFMTQAIVAAQEKETAQQGRLRLHVVFNNVPYKQGLETGWGFACLIEGLGAVIEVMRK